MVFEINDIETDLHYYGEKYHEGAVDYFEPVIIFDNDINYLEDIEALGRGIINVLKTRIGEIDGVGMETMGSRLLTLRGQVLNNHTTDLATVFINEIIPQFNGKIIEFSDIKVMQKDRSKIAITFNALTIYGSINIFLNI